MRVSLKDRLRTRTRTRAGGQAGRGHRTRPSGDWLESRELLSVGGVLKAQVLQAAVTAATQTAVTASVNPVPDGGSVTYTAAVSAPGDPGLTPTGTVLFLVDGASFGSPVALSGGSAALPVSGLAYGTHTVAAFYTPDDVTQFAYSNGALVGGSTFQSSTTTTVDAPATATYNQPVTLTATVTAKPGAATPTGTVAFYSNDGLLATRALSGGSATYAVPLPVGSNTITAVYKGSTAAAGSVSSGQVVVVNV
mgnify:CR=1 FL=1